MFHIYVLVGTLTLNCVLWLLWTIGLLEFIKFRNEFPFNGRIAVLMYLTYGTIYVMTIFDVCFVLVELLSNCKEINCISDTLTMLSYCTGCPLLCWVYAYRGFVLLSQYHTQEIVQRIAQFRKTGEMQDNTPSIESLENSFWIKQRYCMKPRFIILSTTCFEVCIIAITCIAFFSPETYDMQVFYSILFSSVVSCMICIFAIGVGVKLKKQRKDNLGLVVELKNSGVFLMIFVVLTSSFYLIDRGFFHQIGTELWLQCILSYGMFVISLYHNLILVDRSKPEIPFDMTATMIENNISIASNLSVGVKQRHVVSLFRTQQCVDPSFIGVMSSCEGFQAFYDFLSGEFMSHNLRFVKRARLIKASILCKLDSVITSQENVGRKNSSNNPNTEGKAPVYVNKRRSLDLSPDIPHIRKRTVSFSGLPERKVEFSLKSNSRSKEKRKNIYAELSPNNNKKRGFSFSGRQESKSNKEKRKLYQDEVFPLVPGALFHEHIRTDSALIGLGDNNFLENPCCNSFLSEVVDIANMFLRDNMASEIDISTNLKSSILSRIDMLEEEALKRGAESLSIYSTTNQISMNVAFLNKLYIVFDLALLEIYEILELNPFPRFKKTTSFQNLCQCPEAKMDINSFG